MVKGEGWLKEKELVEGKGWLKENCWLKEKVV